MKASDKELLRFALADHAFAEAAAMAKHIVSANMEPDSYLFSGSVAGLVVSYSRPFMSATGLGPLPSSMSEFGGEQDAIVLCDTHNKILEARNKLVAHFDREHSEEKYKGGSLRLPPSRVTVKLRIGGFFVGTNASYLNPAAVEASRRLCEVQRERVRKRLGYFASELLKEHKGLGDFTFDIP